MTDDRQGQRPLQHHPEVSMKGATASIPGVSNWAPVWGNSKSSIDWGTVMAAYCQ